MIRVTSLYASNSLYVSTRTCANLLKLPHPAARALQQGIWYLDEPPNHPVYNHILINKPSIFGDPDGFRNLILQPSFLARSAAIPLEPPLLNGLVRPEPGCQARNISKAFILAEWLPSSKRQWWYLIVQAGKRTLLGGTPFLDEPH